MTTMKIAGFLFVGLGVAALVGGGIWYWRRRKKQQGSGDTPQVVPSKPPRAPTDPAANTNPRGHQVPNDKLDPELRKELAKLKQELLQPDEDSLNNLETDDVIAFAVESEPVGNYTETRQELLSAKVLSVDSANVRARVMGPVEYAEHHGAHAGHGFRVGDLVEVSRANVLVAGRRSEPQEPQGYGSKGNPAATFKPSTTTKETYKVKPGTPYDLVLPYRTKELAWYVDEKLVTLVHIGEDGLIEQIMFSEDSLRGEVSVRALDEDPKVGTVFVARWDFVLDA